MSGFLGGAVSLDGSFLMPVRSYYLSEAHFFLEFSMSLVFSSQVLSKEMTPKNSLQILNLGMAWVRLVLMAEKS